MTAADIEAIVVGAIRNANLARPPDTQLSEAPDAVVFGPGSPLDSLGLVALMIDIEDAFADHSVTLSLSNDHAMSQRQSPFRSVPSLVAYIHTVLAEAV